MNKNILKYEIKNGEVTITGCDKSATEVEIPSEIEGYPVTHIGDEAFVECSNLKSIVIPNSVTAIGDWAFGDCENLQSIEIPETVVEMGDNVFTSCSTLKRIKFPSNITHIGEYMCSYCKELEEVVLSEYTVSMNEGAFYECTNLKEINIPETLEHIDEVAFFGCSKLNLQISNKVNICRDALSFNGIHDKTPLTPKEFLKEMKKYNNDDPDSDHWNADTLMEELLISLGYGEGVTEFRQIDKWYS